MANWVRVKDTPPPRGDTPIWVYPFNGKVEQVCGDWWVYRQPVTHWMLIEKPRPPETQEAGQK